MLADDAPLQPLSYYVVERSVAVHHIRGEDLAYDCLPGGSDGLDMHPQFHDHEYYAHFDGRRPQAQWSKWRLFCEVVGPMVEGVYRKGVPAEP